MNNKERYVHNATILHKLFTDILKVLIRLKREPYTNSELRKELAVSGGICGLYKQFTKSMIAEGNTLLKHADGKDVDNTTFQYAMTNSKELFGLHLMNPNKLDQVYYWKPHIFVKKGRVVGVKIRIRFVKGALEQLIGIINKAKHEKTITQVSKINKDLLKD